MASDSDLRTILATDCGSTTTKAVLIERQSDGYRLIARAEAPTTVEAPVEDVTGGVLNAVAELEEVTSRRLIRNDRIFTPRDGPDGVDAFVSTSSAGGGLQMVIAGVVGKLTAHSAARSALGAGALVMDTISCDDDRLPHERIEQLRARCPDIVLIAGGTDGGTVKHVAALSEMVAAADPRPRFGAARRLPVIYAGNRAARDEVARILGDRADLTHADNVRPDLDSEQLASARDRIHEIFLAHVMQQAPGYERLLSWTTTPLMPTPAAVGLMMQHLARADHVNLLGVDIGGATTDVFSVLHSDSAGSPPRYHRTVSANLGLSYNIFNVVVEAGLDNILRWLPMPVDERATRNRLRNKMIRPTTIPETLEELMVEQVVCREALRLALAQHRAMAADSVTPLRARSFADLFAPRTPAPPIDMLAIDLLVGSGGVLSHSPHYRQAALMMIDAFEPEGFTALAVDSVFLLPQLGVLSTLHEAAALDVLRRDGLVHLGWCLAPCSGGRVRPGRPCITVEMETDRGRATHAVRVGEMLRVPLDTGQTARVTARPARPFDVGRGRGRPVSRSITGGEAGLIIDGRGRPLRLPTRTAERRAALQRWHAALDIYPESGYE